MKVAAAGDELRTSSYQYPVEETLDLPKTAQRCTSIGKGRFRARGGYVVRIRFLRSTPPEKTIMRKSVLLPLLLSLFAATAVAQGPKRGQTPQAQPGQQTQQMQMQQMQSRMQAMQALMSQIHSTQDPAERARLMQEHMQSLNQGMMMMGHMMQGPTGQGQGQCAQNDTQCQMHQMQMQQQMMGQRMGMMQMMMQQMMEHMSQEQGTEAPKGDGK